MAANATDEPAAETVEVVAETKRAKALLDETRLRLLAELTEPASAATLARRLDLPRQRVNYHLRELEAHRLVELVEERRRGSATERVYRRAGLGFVISNAALGELGSDPDDVNDRFSSSYQIALAARAIRELGALREGARAAGKKLPTFALDTEVRYASPADRAAFAEELAAAVADLVRKYHRDGGAGDEDARAFRFAVAGYPKPKG